MDFVASSQGGSGAVTSGGLLPGVGVCRAIRWNTGAGDWRVKIILILAGLAIGLFGFQHFVSREESFGFVLRRGRQSHLALRLHLSRHDRGASSGPSTGVYAN